jgi:hypothetical protein
MTEYERYNSNIEDEEMSLKKEPMTTERTLMSGQSHKLDSAILFKRTEKGRDSHYVINM